MSESERSEDAAVHLLTELALALHRAGVPTHRLEASVSQVADALALEAQVLGLPTALWVAIGPAGSSTITMHREPPAEVDLGSIVDLDQLIADVIDGLDPREARERLHALTAEPPPRSRTSILLAWSASSGAAAVLLGGGVVDVVMSALCGGLVALLAVVLSRTASTSRQLLPLAALVTAGTARALATVVPMDPGVVTLAGLIVLFPGFTFTVGMVELATSNLVSGVARLASASLSLLLLVLGVGVADVLIAVPPPLAGQLPLPAPLWWVCAVLSPVTFAALLGARPRHLPAVMVVGMAGLGANAFVAAAYEPHIGAAAGALAIGLSSNLWARLADRPASVVLVPGMLLMVPGSVGFRSLTAMLSGDVLTGVAQGFEMAMTAIALASGLLLSQVFLRPRRET